MNIKEMKELIQLMNENNLTEVELEKEGLKIRLKKGSSGIETMVVHEARHSAPHQTRANDAPAEAPKAAPAKAGTTIKSPMVGTFYSSPAPDAAHFVQPGAQVQVGQVICIIEAMKLMNEIKAEIAGRVTEVLVNNGDPVEFGQPLFRIE